MRRYVVAALAAGALVAAAPAAGDGGPPQNAVQGWDGAARGAVRGPKGHTLVTITRDFPT